MPQDELAAWLRASAENKITTKNTWRATLIEHFSDISRFREQHGMNFQKAGCALEGCVKVYSTRVDDVSESTNKLLGLFGKEENPKRRAGKRKTDFIEKNINNINLKETLSSHFYDPIFSSVLARADGLFLVDMLEQTAAGMFIYENQAETIVYEDAEVIFELKALPICASLREIRGVENTEPAPDPGECKHEEECYPADSNHMDIGDDDLDAGPEEAAPNVCYADVPVLSKAPESPVYEETPFGYFKGWAGPSHWKATTPTARAADRPKKQRERHFIDFLRDTDHAFLFEKADTTMSKEQILERRRDRNLMPEDFSYKRADLYKYLIKDGQFVNSWGCTEKSGEHVEEVLADNDFTTFDADAEDINGAGDIGDASIAEPDLSSRLEQSLILEDNEPNAALKAPRAPKKVDIKKLKENVHNLLQGERSSLRDIYKGIPELYSPRETKDISPHMCLISLLHLANENSYELSQAENDIYIQR